MKDSIIIIGLVAALIIGAVFYIDKKEDDDFRRGFESGWSIGFDSGKASIKPVASRRDTIRDTVRVGSSKPASRPVASKDTAAINSLISDLQQDNDSLKNKVVRLLQPKSFYISDSLGAAVINYDPFSDEYSGFMIHATIQSDSNFIESQNIPCPDPPEPELGYIHSSIYIAG